jgi:cytochrome c5
VEEQTDSTFIKNMAIVVVILIVFTIAIAFLARDAGYKDHDSDNPSRATTAEERIKPVAGVYTGEEGATAIEQAVAVAVAAPAQAPVSEADIDGEKLYAGTCAACHSTGVAGAPKPGSPEMAQRAEKGMDALMQTAVNGLNAMPARGGRPDLSDAQIQAIIEFMLQ